MKQRLTSRHVQILASAVFFVTGFSALAYQVAWQRMLTLFAGSDIGSATLVIAGFLGGLGAGSLISRTFVDRIEPRTALAAFGISNIAIALYGAFSKVLFYDLLVQQGSWLAGNQATGFLAIFIALLIPTALMGMSLPLLARALIVKIDLAGNEVGRLYALNTLGSVVGALVSGWYLVTVLGYEGTLYVASAISVAAGAATVLASRVREFAQREQATPSRVRRSVDPFRLSHWAMPVLLSGFAAISLEIVWLRLLGVILFTTSYTFGHLLAFILAGYGLGGLAGAALLRGKDPRRSFMVATIGAISLAILSILGISFFGPVYSSWFQPNVPVAGSRWFFDFLFLPAFLLLPPNFLLGVSFVALQNGIQTNSAAVGSRIALLQAFNTTGNVLGSVVTGLVLLHVLGTIGTLKILSLISIGFLLVLLAGRRTVGTAAALLVSIGFVLWLPANGDFWAAMHTYKMPGNEIALVAEDSTGVSALVDHQLGSIAVNAELEGSFSYNPPTTSTHTSLGMLGALIHPDPQDILVIGIGSGNTPIAAGVNPATETIRAVEIVGSEIPILKSFAAQNPDHPINILFEDPRFEIVIADGRKDLVLGTRLYDLIEADAIRPWKSGSGFLFSLEFFEAARDRLKPGGFMVQWPATERVRNTFTAVFPYVVQLRDSAMIGSMQPIEIDLGKILDRFEASSFGRDYVAALGMSFDLVEFISQVSPVEVSLTTEVNRDLFPRDETHLLDEWQAAEFARSFDLAEGFRQEKDFASAARFYAEALAIQPRNVEILERLADAYSKVGMEDLARQTVARLIELKKVRLVVVTAWVEIYSANGFEVQAEGMRSEAARLVEEIRRLERL